MGRSWCLTTFVAIFMVAAMMIIVLFGFCRENFAIAGINSYFSRAPVVLHVNLQ